jgi:hypothetical protein
MTWNSDCQACKQDKLTMVCDDHWGIYCPHGKQVIEVTPASRGTGYGREGRPVSPWLCDRPGCSQEEFERREAEEVAACEEERWEEYRRLMYG